MNFDDDVSESGDRDDLAVKASYIEKVIISARASSIPEVEVELPKTTTLKVTNVIPQIHRVPIFSENAQTQKADNHQTKDKAPEKKVNSRSSPPRPPTTSTPSRATTSQRPRTSNRTITSASTNQQPPPSSPPQQHQPTTNITNVSPVKQANLENRILIRLANILPADEAKDIHLSRGHGHSHNSHNHGHPHGPASGHHLEFSKLPESRNMLLKLNHDLDDVVGEIRRLGLEFDRFNFGDINPQGTKQDRKDFESGPSLDNNPLVFDQVIAELSAQAAKKVSRIKKLYRSQLTKLKKQHDDHVMELKFQVDTLSSKLFEAQMRHETVDEVLHGAVDGSGGVIDPLKHHDRLVKALREEHDNMQEVLLSRLESERKVLLWSTFPALSMPYEKALCVLDVIREGKCPLCAAEGITRPAGFSKAANRRGIVALSKK